MSLQNWKFEPGRGWGPLELGRTRDEILVRLNQEHMAFSLDEADPAWLEIGGAAAELFFTRDERPVLWQIGIEGDDVDLGGRVAVGRRLDEALLAFGVQQFQDTLWTLDDDPEELTEPDGGGRPDDHPPPAPAAAETLLKRGVLWVRSLGLGFYLDEGTVYELYLRAPAQVPTRGCGPLTHEQLELAISDDLQERLSGTTRRPASWLRKLATIALILTVAGLAVESFRHQQRWHNAPRAEGKVIAIEQGPPPGRRQIHVIEYRDGTGAAHQVRWTLADMYVTREVGETVEVPYLAGDPAETLGPARIRDAAFFRFVPSLLAALLVYAGVLYLDMRLLARSA